eukprot:5384132-Lingulodinium_polyedra.AAC.1
MSGSVVIRTDWIEVAHGAFDHAKWSGDRHRGQSPKPSSHPGVSFYRAGDIARFARVERHVSAR